MKDNILLNLVYPKNITCAICSNDIFDDADNGICPNCRKSLPQILGQVCFRCGNPIHSIDRYCDMCKKPKPYLMARACFEYSGKIVTLIHNLKFHNAKYLSEIFAKNLCELYKREKYNCDIIVAVPMTKKSVKYRGYNQAELLAIELGKLLNLSVDVTHLVKIKETKQQVGLDFVERRNNLQNAFFVTDKTFFCGKNVLIVDDVFTTGATIESCSIALNKAGAKGVFALTCAHTREKH